MAYPIKKITVEEYENAYASTIENMQYNKIYYMPEIVDGNAAWIINFYNINEKEEDPYTSVRVVILKGYRVLLTKKATAGDEQLFFVENSGYDSDGKPWIDARMVANAADIDFKDLPAGTTIYWTTRTFFPPSIRKYTAQIERKYIKGGVYKGMYLTYGASPVVFPEGNVTAEGLYTTVYNVNVLITDTNSTILESKDFKPSDYGILEFLAKNEVFFD